MHAESRSSENAGQCFRLRVKRITRLGPSKLQLETNKIDIPNQTPTSSLSNGQDKWAAGQDDQLTINVEGLWTSLRFTVEAIIHLKDAHYNKTENNYTVDNSRGLLVLEPDNLITCTAVASTLFCERKAWLNHVFLGQVGTNRAMLVGTLVHEVFQYGVKHKNPKLEDLIKYLDELLDDATVMLEIYSVELQLSDIRTEAISYLSSVKEWIEKFMLAGPGYPLTNDQQLEVKVTGISDIEENVWSTKYGLKGKIDVTGAVRVYDKRTKRLENKTLPLELKTGNPNLSLSHSAQVSLYSMMIEDRYAETNQGLVIYLKNQAAMHNVTLTHATKRDLVLRRNQLNYHMKSSFFGPEMENQLRMCKNCERLTECILMSEMYDHDLDRFSTMMSLRPDAIGHLDGRFRSFFMKYHEKLARMMNSTAKTIGADGEKSQDLKSASFWTYSSAEAESRGTGFGKLQATSCEGKVIKFIRHPDFKGNFTQLNGHKSDAETRNNPTKNHLTPEKNVKKKMKIDDYFKPKKVHTAEEAKGGPELKPFDTEFNFSRFRVAISLDEDKSSMDSQNSSTAIAIGFMQELKKYEFSLKLYEGEFDIRNPDRMYRVDRIEKRANLDIERMVLVRLLAREDWRCDRVRQLILEPSFKPSENVDVNLFVMSAGFEEINELPDELQQPVIDAVSTDNYYIMTEKSIPNRGKVNKVVGSIVQVLRELDRTVLIVAQNIDNLMDLMRVLQKKCKFIIIDDGKSTKARFQYASNLVKVPQDDTMDLNRKFEVYIKQHEVAPVVITTFAMSIGGLQFTRRAFDYCVVYDCDNVELLVGLSPMFCSDKHLLLDVRDEAARGSMVADKKDESDVTLGEHLRILRGSQGGQ